MLIFICDLYAMMQFGQLEKVCLLLSNVSRVVENSFNEIIE